jgi:hypothetical protein
MSKYARYKIIFTPNLDTLQDAEFSREYAELHEAVTVLNAIADYTLMLHETALMPDYTNVGCIFMFEDGEWVEIDEVGIEI